VQEANHKEGEERERERLHLINCQEKERNKGKELEVVELLLAKKGDPTKCGVLGQRGRCIRMGKECFSSFCGYHKNIASSFSLKSVLSQLHLTDLSNLSENLPPKEKLEQLKKEMEMEIKSLKLDKVEAKTILEEREKKEREKKGKKEKGKRESLLFQKLKEAKIKTTHHGELSMGGNDCLKSLKQRKLLLSTLYGREKEKETFEELFRRLEEVVHQLYRIEPFLRVKVSEEEEMFLNMETEEDLSDTEVEKLQDMQQRKKIEARKKADEEKEEDQLWEKRNFEREAEKEKEKEKEEEEEKEKEEKEEKTLQYQLEEISEKLKIPRKRKREIPQEFWVRKERRIDEEEEDIQLHEPENELEEAFEAIDQLHVYYLRNFSRKPIPKQHLLHSHAKTFLSNWLSLGMMSEQGIEGLHACFNKSKSRYRTFGKQASEKAIFFHNLRYESNDYHKQRKRRMTDLLKGA